MRIRDLVKSKLVGRTIDVVGFIDALLEIAGKVGEVHCALASDQALRFELGNEGPCDIELDAARGKLRMLCARLSVHCNETP
ncbi:MAG: hypothetical protein HY289_10365, partial [Planctomycetes bacterium]|nr:hypothetical protein [Planctomycetota bacterium]